MSDPRALRLTLAGPESVGKTTLGQALARRFNTRLAPEYGRSYDEKQMQSRYRRGKGWREQDLIAIAETHAAMRDALTPLAGAVLIEDTDALMTAVWAEYLLGSPSRTVERIARENLADHYLLLSPETPWVDDGVRYAGQQEIRDWFFAAAKARLDQWGASYTIIAGADWDSRTAAAIAAADALLPGRM